MVFLFEQFSALCFVAQPAQRNCSCGGNAMREKKYIMVFAVADDEGLARVVRGRI
jgi:hypothetical protein